MKMMSWHERQIASLLAASSEQDVYAVLAAAGRELGFKYCAYVMKMPLPVAEPRMLQLDNYPQAWREFCEAHYSTQLDPVAAHCVQSAMPLFWPTDESEYTPYWRDAHAHGVKFGCSHPCYGANGSKGLLTFVGRDAPMTAEDVDAVMGRMSWLLHVAHNSFSRVMIDKVCPVGARELTTRELDVLKWSADGKTALEVAEILHISERTANFHITNAVIKLGASNKTAGVIKAALLQLI